MTLKTTIPAKTLAANMPDIVLESSASVDFVIKAEGNTVLTEHYNPDTNNEIAIRGLDNVLKKLLYGTLEYGSQTEGRMTIDFQVDGASIGTTVAIASSYYVPKMLGDLTAAILRRNKGGMSYLAYPKIMTVLGVITAELSNAAGETLKTVTIGAANTITTQNCNAAEMFGSSLAETGVLVKYLIGGEAKAYDLISNEQNKGYMVLRFLNSYDMAESVVAKGVHTVKPGISQTSSSYHGRNVVFDVQKTDEYTVKSGAMMTVGEYRTWGDLASTRKAQILYDGNWYDIIIDKPSYTQTLRTGEYGEAEISFKMAKESENGIINI